MRTITVKTAAREGFSLWWAAHRSFEAGKEHVLEVVDDLDDPVGPDGKLLRLQVGQRSLRQLRETPAFVVVDGGVIPPEVVAQSPEDRIHRLETRLGEAEDALARARAGSLPADWESMRAENVALRGRLDEYASKFDELSARLDQARGRKAG